MNTKVFSLPCPLWISPSLLGGLSWITRATTILMSSGPSVYQTSLFCFIFEPLRKATTYKKSLYQNLVLEENNRGIEKIRSTMSVWIKKWSLLSCFEGPALFSSRCLERATSENWKIFRTFCWNFSFLAFDQYTDGEFLFSSHHLEASSQTH